MIYLTGDTHRDFRRVEHFCKRAETTKDDILIILGDAGINYYGPGLDNALKCILEALPVTLLCVHGNHEKRPQSVAVQPGTACAYDLLPWHGGHAYIESPYPSIVFAKDGEIYDLGGKRCVVIGGAYSVDKEIRLAQRLGWWPDEQPSVEIKQRVRAMLINSHWEVDAVLSHTCPHRYIPREMFLAGIDQRDVDDSTERWLDGIEKELDYGRWYCGHWHTDKTVDKMRFMFNDFIELQ